MRLKEARIQKYRSIRDTGWFGIEHGKTILVGPNEAGKTVILQALQQINPPKGVRPFDSLRDYPRSEYNDITTGKVRPENITVAEARFSLDPADKEALPAGFEDCIYVRGRKLDNTAWNDLKGGPQIPNYRAIKNDLARLCAHINSRVPEPNEGSPPKSLPGEEFEKMSESWGDTLAISGDISTKLQTWLKKILPQVDENNETETSRHDRLSKAVDISGERKNALEILDKRLPVFVLFNNYFRVRPLIHLEHLALRIEKNLLDDEYYDFGNKCLLQFLGFNARELSSLGKATEPPAGNADALRKYRDQLDRRSYQLNAASVRLTDEIGRVWLPDKVRGESDRLRVVADAQYLKVVVEDDLGVEIELDQRSEGFQWLVSFFIVFFAEAEGNHKNAILLLDEPGLSLHGLKQRDFRMTISRLAETNQTLYTTHSPFLVGPDELDLVRVVEMTNRKVGTIVHTTITAEDPAALLPLQEALGYDMAQSLFGQHRNLILEGLTDYWYLDSMAHLLREAGLVNLNEKIALVPAKTAGKVVYYATILHAQKLKVAALLDSDSAGEQAAKQDVLVHTLGNKAILRTKDAYEGEVKTPEIEDLLRATLIEVAKTELGWDIATVAITQPSRPIIDIFASEVKDFSKYHLSKTFIRWTRNHEAKDLTGNERSNWKKLIELINIILK